jgi:hypothetical protein
MLGLRFERLVKVMWLRRLPLDRGRPLAVSLSWKT